MASAAERTLTSGELNRALLARQHLLERARSTVPRVLESVAGLQAQYAPAMYIGLWSRLDGFQRADLTSALEQRTVAQGTLMRSTIHLVSAGDYWPFAIGIRRPRRDWYQRVTRDKPPAAELERTARQLRASLMDGPVRRAELDRLVTADYRTGVGLWLDLVRVPPSGTWERRRADLYAAAEDWLGPPSTSAEEGVNLLVRRYLGGFGPATRAEIADWAGLPVSEITKALARLRAGARPAVRYFRTVDGAELVDLTGAPRPAAHTPAPVRFLPVWDATLLVHARRSGILAEEHRSKVFSTKNPHSVNTFLVDGTVGGTWRYERGQIQTEEFHPLDKAVRREVDEEAEKLAAFHA